MQTIKSFIHFAAIVLILILVSCEKQEVPIISTSAVSDITETSASSGGNITSDGGANVFEKGVCWHIYSNPTISNSKTSDGTGSGVFISHLTGLTANTVYYLRAFATNSIGTNYGNLLSFATTSSSNNILFNINLDYGTVADIDGNIYKTVMIGTQVWMAENLKTNRLNDGSSIPVVTDYKTWESTGTSAYCWYNNNNCTYGALYNWHTVNTGKLCPAGWHVPNENDWTTLSIYLGGYTVAGGKIKEEGTNHWQSPNEGASNETGFTALPGGWRGSDGSFNQIGEVGSFWESTKLDNRYPLFRDVYYQGFSLEHYGTVETAGLSIRCIKDN